MKFRLFRAGLALIFLILTMVLGSGLPAPAASRTVPGDVLVTFKNPSKTSKVTAASLFQGSKTKKPGANAAYVQSVAEELGAKVARIYETLSVSGNELVVLLHSDTKTEQELLRELRARPDVKGASLNYVKTLKKTRKPRR